MAGVDNLKKFSEMDAEERKRISTAGGKASGEARRRKKLMKEQLDTLLSLDVKSPKARKQMETLGINPDDMDNQMALMVAMFQQGMKGNVKAFVAIRDTIGEMPVATHNLNITDNPFAGLSTEELRELIDDD